MLVVFELSFVHFAHSATRSFLVHLAAQEVLVLPIDFSHLGGEPLLLQLIVVLVRLPDASLLIVVGLLGLLAHFLLPHLARQKFAHLVFLLLLTSSTSLVFHASTHLLLHFVVHQSLLLVLNAHLLLRDNVAGQSVHKVLGASFTSAELSQTVLFLLVKHLAVLVLCLDICANLSFALFISGLLISLVLRKHFLEILLFLTTLLLLKGALHFHLLLQTGDKVDLSLELFLMLSPLASFLFLELAVAALLLLHNFLVLSSQFLLLALAEKLDVL